jgi:hypothetical protein
LIEVKDPQLTVPLWQESPCKTTAIRHGFARQVDWIRDCCSQEQEENPDKIAKLIAQPPNIMYY